MYQLHVHTIRVLQMVTPTNILYTQTVPEIQPTTSSDY